MKNKNNLSIFNDVFLNFCFPLQIIYGQAIMSFKKEEPSFENPWSIQSIYELQYFNCPSCAFKRQSKQEFINHAYEVHPESIEYLNEIKDGSLSGTICPWDIKPAFEESGGFIYKNSNLVPELTNTIYNVKEVIFVVPNSSNIEEKDIIEQSVSTTPNSKEIAKRHTCNHCSKSFSKKGYLQSHIKSVHEKIRDHKCEQCDRAFFQKSNLKSHIKQIHENAPKTKACDICGKLLGQTTSLQKHIKLVHKGIKDFICEECGKAFGEKGELNRHFRNVHLDEENGVTKNKERCTCEICGISLVSFNGLKEHIKKIHKGIKNYKCER